MVITVLNAYSGFALVAEGNGITELLNDKSDCWLGFMLDNALLTTVGALIGVSGSILSYVMCVAMNRSLTNVLFGGMAQAPTTDVKIEGAITQTNIDDTVEALVNADSVILVRFFCKCLSYYSYRCTGCRLRHGCSRRSTSDLGYCQYAQSQGR